MEHNGQQQQPQEEALKQNSNQVVNIDEDSEMDLQALFDSVLKPDSSRPLQVPLRMRNLPNSFFNPPLTGSKSPSISHSRENSADSTVQQQAQPQAATQAQAAQQLQQANNEQPLVVSHSRAHSSPASLQQTYAAAQQQQQHAPQPHARQHHHQKQRSYDVIGSTVDDLGPLPHGWEQARTAEGQIYYMK